MKTSVIILGINCNLWYHFMNKDEFEKSKNHNIILFSSLSFKVISKRKLEAIFMHLYLNSIVIVFHHIQHAYITAQTDIIVLQEVNTDTYSS